MTVSKRMVVVGGGIAGCVTALKLSKLKNTVVDIYERRSNLLFNLPYCHLHVAGVLYPELSIPECEKLFYESLAFAKEFRRFLNVRPTIVAYKSSSLYNPKELIFKLRTIRLLYRTKGQRIFGDPDHFFKVYTRDDMLYFKKYGKLSDDDTPYTRYIENFCSLIKNVDDIKYPFVSVMEPGINQVALENHLGQVIKNTKNINVYTNTLVEKMEYINKKWKVNSNETYDFLINAMGHVSSSWFPIQEREYLEYKSSWLIEISSESFQHRTAIPEIALIGERGTEDGMIQLTPIRIENAIRFQVHYMSPKSSIIGMNVSSTITQSEITKRSARAKDHILQTFNIKSTQMRSLNIALDGIQRTVSDSHSKRNSEVITTENYAEIRLIKATGISRVSDILVGRVSMKRFPHRHAVSLRSHSMPVGRGD